MVRGRQLHSWRIIPTDECHLVNGVKPPYGGLGKLKLGESKMKFLILSLTFITLFVVMSIVVTASGLGVIDLWLEANTDLSTLEIAAINWGLWGAYFASFAAGLKISGGHI